MIVKTLEVCFCGIIAMTTVTMIALLGLVLRRIIDELCAGRP